MIDQYAITAEFYDLLAGPLWTRMGPALAAALAGADPSAGPVLDLGAGTGLSTVAVAEALPDAAVLAVEPSPSLRAVLHSRLAARNDVRERITVLPSDLLGAELPDRLGGAVAISMLGHLDRAARVRLWGLLGARLASGAPAVIELQPPARPEVVPATEFARARLGDLEYEGSGRARPSGPDSVCWTMTYRVLRNGRLIAERTNVFPAWHTVGADDVAAEAATSGLNCTARDNGLLVLRPIPRPSKHHGSELASARPATAAQTR
jgi:SAM-dependent methyltransferase